MYNFVEPVPMQQLCAFCYFSMRFVVSLQLAEYHYYLIYLIYMIASSSDLIPLWAFVLPAAVYGL